MKTAKIELLLTLKDPYEGKNKWLNEGKHDLDLMLFSQNKSKAKKEYPELRNPAKNTTDLEETQVQISPSSCLL